MSGATGCICPFFSIDNVWIESRDDDNYLKCENCGATRPDECDAFYAMEAWNKPLADKILKEAYNAGMERAAEIASNVKAPFSRFTIAAKIRNEINK